MSVLIQEMTWQELQAKKNTVAILPVGATEQHGPHLPLCTDAKIAEEFARRLAEQVGGIVLPTMNYGYKSNPRSGGGPLFPGTIDLEGDTLTRFTHDVLMELVRDGFRKIFIMNAHFENEAFLVEAMDLVSRESGRAATIVEASWWDAMDAAAIADVFDDEPFPGWAAEHAALTETSLMLCFAPELCHMDRAADEVPGVAPHYFRYPVKRGDVPDSGALAPCTAASAERGKRIVAHALPVLAGICKTEFGLA